MTTERSSWLLLIHRIPSRPAYLRVRIGRELRRAGAVAIKSTVYVAPAEPALRAPLSAVAREIVHAGGEAVVCEARFVEGLANGAVEDLFRAASDAEYSTILAEAKPLGATLKGRRAASESARRSAGRALERLRARFDQVIAKDRFGAAGRERVARQLSLLEDRIQGVEEGRKPQAAHAELPRGATWVTRRGVMVDRISSAWLIRRFIDPQASFKFVPGRGYRSLPRELRFDMAGAEFTHEGDRCTFEVLIERFGLRDSALRPIAEIVHDLDLEDEAFGRPETPGVGRLIVGLAIAESDDAARVARGSAIFESLYESFRRKNR